MRPPSYREGSRERAGNEQGLNWVVTAPRAQIIAAEFLPILMPSTRVGTLLGQKSQAGSPRKSMIRGYSTVIGHEVFLASGNSAGHFPSSSV